MIEFEIADNNFSTQLVQFWRESFLAAYSDVHSAENIQAYFSASYTIEEANKMLSSEHFFCLKANRNQQTVGIAIVNYRRCSLNEGLDTAELKHLYLLPSAYGTGLAHKMMDEVFRSVKKESKSHVWLSVSKLNIRAQRFYKKLGFECIGDGDDIHVGNEVLASLIMIKKLVN
ncbi:MAG: GNAT family N-acetyltransferase [Ekhidna sp.]